MDDRILTPDEKRRFSRNIMLPEIGPDGQRKLFDAKVLLVGCGALGTVAAMYLAASGVGTLGLVDFDTIDISNLQRQLAFTTGDVGKPKATVLEEKLLAVNPSVKINRHDGLLRRKNAAEIIDDYDVVIEGSDNPDTKHLVSETCRQLGKPCVVGGVRGVNGQVLTFKPGHAAYGDFFPEAAAAGGYTPCSLGGVLGPLTGVVGSIQACEAIKLIVGFGQPLVDTLLLIDTPTMQFTRITI